MHLILIIGEHMRRAALILSLLLMSTVLLRVSAQPSKPDPKKVLETVLGPIEPFVEIGIALLFGATVIAFIVFMIVALGNWLWGGPFGKLMAMSSLWRAITVLAVIGIVFLIAYNIEPIAEALNFPEAKALGDIVVNMVNRGFRHFSNYFAGGT